MKALVPLVFLLASAGAGAEGLAWSLQAGAGVADRDRFAEPPYEFFQLSFEDERLLRLEGSVKTPGGWGVRGRFTRTTYDVRGSGGLQVSENQVADEIELGLFLELQDLGPLTPRFGAGYLSLNGDQLDVAADGGMLEAGTRWRALECLDLDLSLAAAHFWARQDKAFDRLDLQLAAIAHLGRVDLSLNARRYDAHGQGFHDDGAFQYSLNLGSTWPASATRD